MNAIKDDDPADTVLSIRLRRHKPWRQRIPATFLGLLLGIGAMDPLFAQEPPPAALPLGSLKTVPVPKVAGLKQFLRVDASGNIKPSAKKALLVLGKAMFWDQAVGSDGKACASCHFNAGADSRTKHQLNPGLRPESPDSQFSTEAPFHFSNNHHLKATDYPFFRSLDPDDGVDPDIFTNDITSSQGVSKGSFISTFFSDCPGDLFPLIGKICDEGTSFLEDVIFGTRRQVEPRNAPTMIGAVFNERNFWDGRARSEFNGVNPLGDLDPYARVLLYCGTATDSLGKCKENGGPLQKIRLTDTARLINSSLASQSVGPPLNELEMSFPGRSFPLLGKKLLGLSQALPGQMVATDDSVLGKYSKAPAKGINLTYKQLVEAAFQDKWWKSGNIKVSVAAQQPALDKTINISFAQTGEFTQMEFNFSLFWGLAIQAYESTLIPSQTPFDRAFESGKPYNYSHASWGEKEKLGLTTFIGKGRCAACHGGAELTNASVRNVRNQKIERMVMGDDRVAVYDNGFYNTTVTLCDRGNSSGICHDIGLGASMGPLNLPLSRSRFFQQAPVCKFGNLVVNGSSFTGCTSAPLMPERPEEGIAFNLLQPDERVAVDGAFKTPGLRNVALTAPYFHHGGILSLRDVVEFYDRGGNFRRANQDNRDIDITRLNLTEEEKVGLVKLMEAMTDARVRHERAPFDHPELHVPSLGTLPAVGAGGVATPQPTFSDNLAP